MDLAHNPFQRLHDLLAAAREKPQHAVTLDVWASVFSVSPTDVPALVKALAGLIALIDESKNAAERFIPGDKARFITPLIKIEGLLKAQNLAAQWANYAPHLDEGTMLALDFGIYAMSQYYPTSSPERSTQISELVDGLNMLLSECLESDLPSDLKRLFTKHLEALRTALLAFRVDGVEGLEDVMDSISGSMLRYRDPIKAELEAGNEFVKSFFEILGKANDVVSGYQTTVQIASSTAVTILLPLFH
jgi:hypothetical protein